MIYASIKEESGVCVETTPYYHCISRCVRRAFLCGKDKYTGVSYEHRRLWVEDKLLFLPTVFAIDVCAYAVMNNHTHVVLHIDEKQTENWSTKETLKRWHQLFKGTLLTQQYVNDEALSEVELETVNATANIYKSRLCDISWFMRVLNEGIARQANKEDKCTGRFWQGRFISQALLDEAALITCMAYVDLNPVRANIASCAEESSYTSIKQRIQGILNNTQPISLLPFVGEVEERIPKGLMFKLEDYIELVDMTGRCIREDKAGFIAQDKPSILINLNISEENWVLMSKRFTRVFRGAVGKEDSLTQYHEDRRHKRRSNHKNCQRLLA